MCNASSWLPPKQWQRPTTEYPHTPRDMGQPESVEAERVSLAHEPRSASVLRKNHTCANTLADLGSHAGKSRFKETTHGPPSFRHRHRRDRARGRTGLCAGGFSVACDHHRQRLSTRRPQRYRDPAAGRGHGAHPQAAGRGRSQGRCRRAGRGTGGRVRQARRLYAAVAQHRDLRLRRGRQAVRPSAQDDARPLHSSRAPGCGSGSAPRQRAATLQDAQGVHRRRQGATGHACLQFGRALWRQPSAAGVSGKGRRAR